MVRVVSCQDLSAVLFLMTLVQLVPLTIESLSSGFVPIRQVVSCRDLSNNLDTKTAFVQSMPPTTEA